MYPELSKVERTRIYVLVFILMGAVTGVEVFCLLKLVSSIVTIFTVAAMNIGLYLWLCYKDRMFVEK